MAPETTDNMPPKYLKVKIENIPAELKQLEQWVVWMPKWDGTRWTKVLICARLGDEERVGKLASHSDPTSWATFDDAVTAYTGIPGLYAGIGFVLSEDDPFCAIDLDRCRDPQSGEVAEWAQRIIDRFRSYAEISPSGTGIHVFMKAKLPGTGRKRSGVEVYDRLRFLTVTGQRVEGAR